MKKPLYYLSTIFVLASTFLSACQNHEDMPHPGTGIQISLVDMPQVETKATPAELGKPVATHFHLNVQNVQTGQIIYNQSYTDKVIPASTGTYQVTASWGNNAVLALDEPYYEGKTQVEVNQQTTQATLLCKVANALLSVTYANPEMFNSLYSEYGVTVGVQNYSVNLDQTNRQSAYFQAGSAVELTFYATLKDNGNQVSKKLTSNLLPQLYEAGSHTRLTLKAAPQTSGAILDIEKVAVEKINIAATIPQEWLPKPKLTGFKGGVNTLTYIETNDALADAVIQYTTATPLQDMEFALQLQDEKYQAYNKTYTLSTLTEKERSDLQAIGIILPTLSQTALNGQIDLTALTANLQTYAGAEVTNTCSVKIKANNRWSNPTAETYTIKVQKPEFTVNAYPGNVWTKEFTMNALMPEQVTTGKGNYTKLTQQMSYQFSTNQQTWETLPSDLRKTGLQPNTTYYIRGLYRGAIASPSVEVKTFPIIELENGGLEGATITTGADGKVGQSRGARYAWTGWATTNPLSTPNCSAAAYAHNSRSGVRPTTDKPSTSTGTDAVRVITTGYGYGSTYKKIKFFIHSELFLGTEPAEGNDNRTYGITYNSHPTGISFYYKCISNVGNDVSEVKIELYNNTQLLGSGTFQTGAKDVYEKKVLPITYSTDPALMALVPNKISVVFKSGTKSNLTQADLKKMFGPNNFITGNTDTTADCMYRGNELFIDDISLVYDK